MTDTTVTDPTITADADPGAAATPDNGAAIATDPGEAGGQPGPQTDPRDEELKTLRNNVKSLNQAVIDARRGNRGKQPGNGLDAAASFDTPEGKYAVALEIAESRLRGSIESIFPLYPEIPPEEIARVRQNPWAFASRESMLSGDYETAKDEIEQALLTRAEAIAVGKVVPKPAAPAPANLNNNPSPEPAGEPSAPGTEEDQDPWTMPMDKLEKVAMKEKAKLSKTSK